ncbi:mitochondrial large subunit ribosomal protein-domain-containing protein [Xylaria cf. heliscus]|nr:mitochondrial large subunit ribosomal protein-domain-containing protein [Xylaria cf. heliscus]
MLSRFLRPLAARATSLAPTPLRPNRLNTSITALGPLCARTVATTAEAEEATSKPEITTTAAATTTTTTTTDPAEPKSVQQLPYFVGRNNLNNLGVYQQEKRGGNLKFTLLKKNEGDLQALKRDLGDALQLSNKDISVNSVTRHIAIKGHRRDEVLNFLRTMGF